MFKKMRTFAIDLKGRISEAENYTTVELESFWTERVESGAELAIIKTPAIPTDEELNSELLIAEIMSLGENATSWEPQESNVVDSYLKVLFPPEKKYTTRAKAIYSAISATARIRRDLARALDRFRWEGKRYAHHAIDATTHLAEVDMGFLMLKITIDRKSMKTKISQAMDPARPDRPASGPMATRTIAGRRYPGIRFAQVTVPTRMTEEEQSRVRNAMKCVVWGGRRYVEVLGTGGLKNGQIIFVEQSWAKAVARQYHMHPQSALAYGGIIVNECSKALATFEATIKIVKEGDLGTNDSRGWMDEYVFAALKSLDPGHFYQIRGDFIANAATLVKDNLIGTIIDSVKLGLNDTPVQFKGCLKVMRNEVGAHPSVAANIVIPDSCLKPERNDLSGKSFRCVINLGVTEQSYDGTCYLGQTGTIHFPWSVIVSNVIPDSEKEFCKIAQGFDSEGHAELLKKIGAQVKSDTDYMRVMEACLAADGCGSMMRHPFVHSGTKRLLADWMRKLMAGGVEMHTRALADDGFLVVDQAGKLYHGTNWMPKKAAITDYPCRRALTIRFPVRMREDLLPTRHIARPLGTRLLSRAFPNMPHEAVEQAIAEQIYLKNVHVLHGKYAKKFGGDFDFDLVYILDGDRYPNVVEWRRGMQERVQPEKDKQKRISFWHELGRISFEAMRNRVGQVTNTILSAIASGHWEQQYPLAEELQNEVGGLKHDTRADMKKVAQIRKDNNIRDARWIKMLDKADIKSFDDLPKSIEPLHNDDVIARMYNILYKKASELLGDPRELSDYSGLFDGLYGDRAIEKKHKREVSLVNSFYGSQTHKAIAYVAKKREARNAARKAQKELRDAGNLDAAREMDDKVRGLEADYEQAELDGKKGLSFFRNIVCGWGAGKLEEDRMYWGAVCNEVICRRSMYANQDNAGDSKRRPSTGSILMHAFPQQFVTAVAAATDGKEILVDAWKQNWHVTVNIETLAITKVEPAEDGPEKETQLYQGFPVKKQLPNGNTITVTEWKRIVELDALGIDFEDDEARVA
jgi:hypothetical protein